jgi:DNA-binding MarR family transcriptional regulator
MQFYALCSIEADRPVPMNFLADILVCDVSTVTGITDHLINEALIIRQESTPDRRVKILTLT